MIFFSLVALETRDGREGGGGRRLSRVCLAEFRNEEERGRRTATQSVKYPLSCTQTRVGKISPQTLKI
jgi:hypothetical protein